MKNIYTFFIIINLCIKAPWCHTYQFYFFNKINTKIEITANAARCDGAGPITILSSENNLKNPLKVNNNCQEWNIDIKEIGTTNTLRINKPFYGSENYYWAICYNTENKKLEVIPLSPINRITTVGNTETNTAVEFTIDEIKRAAEKIPQKTN